MKDIYTLLQILVGLAGAAMVLELLRYNKACVAAWWYRRIHKELRDAAPWADPKKVRRVYRSECR